MSPLFGPILAQVVSLGVADRTEARYIAAAQDSRAEASTAPRVGLNVQWQHTPLSSSTAGVYYGPTILTTTRDDDPDVMMFHSGSVALSHSERFGRTRFTISQTGNFARTNLRIQALAPPATVVPGGTNPPPVSAPPTTGSPTTGSPTTPTTGTPTNTPGSMIGGGGQVQGVRAVDETVEIFSETTTLNVLHVKSPRVSYGGDLAYTVAGSLRTEDRALFPLVKGPRALIFGTYRLTRRDALTSSLSMQYASLQSGDSGMALIATESWAHRFDARTNGNLSGGLSASRNSKPIGLVSWSIYPTFNASLNHVSLLGRTTLMYGFNVGAAPALDPIRAAVDPRFNFSVFSSLNRGRSTTTLTAGSAISIGSRNDQGSLNSLFGSLTSSYSLGSFASVDGGVRAAWQTFEGLTTVPASFAAFVGLTFAAEVFSTRGY